MLNFHFSDRKTRRLFVLTKGEGVEVLFRERSTFYLSDRSRRIFIFRNPSNLNFSTRIRHRLSIFQCFRTEEAVDFLFFEYFRTVEDVIILFFEYHRTEEAVTFLFFEYFRTEEAVDFLFSRHK